MPASIIRPPCTRYQSECRLTDWRIASRIAWAAASSDMVMVRLHSTDVHQKIPTRESAVLGTLTRLMMTGLNNVNRPMTEPDRITIYNTTYLEPWGPRRNGFNRIKTRNYGCNVK